MDGVFMLQPALMIHLQHVLPKYMYIKYPSKGPLWGLMGNNHKQMSG